MKKNVASLEDFVPFGPRFRMFLCSFIIAVVISSDLLAKGLQNEKFIAFKGCVSKNEHLFSPICSSVPDQEKESDADEKEDAEHADGGGGNKADDDDADCKRNHSEAAGTGSVHSDSITGTATDAFPAPHSLPGAGDAASIPDEEGEEGEQDD